MEQRTAAGGSGELEISVVVPVYDEADSVVELVRRLDAVLGARFGARWEVIFIDDGSKDATWREIIQLRAQYAGRLRGLRHRRNFGKAAALAHGFKMARGRLIVTMDGDLQDQPEELPKFLEKLDAGYDLVSGWKRRRHDPIEKTFPSRAFNFVARSVSGLKLHDINCGYKLYRAEVAQSIRLYGEMHRFIPLLAAAEGYRVGEVVVEHKARAHGHSKYGFTRMVKGALDLLTCVMLTRYLRRPAHFFGGLALVVGSVGIGLLVYLSIGWFLGNKGIGTRPLFFFGILGTLLSAQLLSIGLIAELILYRTHESEREGYVLERLD